MTLQGALYTEWIDLVELDECGDPIGYFCIPCPGTVDITHNYRDLPNVTIDPENTGAECLEFHGCSTYMGSDVTIELKDYTAALQAQFSGQRAVKPKKNGETTGVVFGTEHECEKFFSMRIVQQLATGAGKFQCIAGTEQYLVHHFACIANVKVETSGNVSGSDPLGTTLTAKGFNNPAYGNGPFGDWDAAWPEDLKEVYGFQAQPFVFPEDCSCEWQEWSKVSKKFVPATEEAAPAAA